MNTARRQSELGLVRDRERLVERPETHQRGNGPEGFFLSDPHLARDPVDDRRLVELPVVTAAVHDLRAALDSVLDVRLRAGENGRRAHRAHVGRLVERIADAQRLRPLEQGVEELVLHRLVDEDPLRSRAALACEVEAADDRSVRGLVDVGVRQDDLRPVPAELEHAVLQARVAGNLLASLDRPGEDHGADLRMGDERLADVASAVDDVDRAGREPGIVQDLREHVRAERRVLGRLPDDGTADREPVDDRDPRDVDREVPRRDGRNDPDRLLDDQDAFRVRSLLGRGQHLAGVAQNILRGATEVVGRELLHLLA